MNTVILAILSSTLVSAIVSGIITLYMKRVDYKQEYYKQIINKRLEAYSYIETQLSVLKSSTLDTESRDPHPYYMIFAFGYEKYLEFQQNLFTAISKNIWINQETSESLDKLSRLFFKITSSIKDITDREELIKLGKIYYKEIAALRYEIEILCRNDLFFLYNFKDLKKNKKREKQFIEIDIS